MEFDGKVPKPKRPTVHWKKNIKYLFPNMKRYPHTMYKGSSRKIARNLAEHRRLQQLGYTH